MNNGNNSGCLAILGVVFLILIIIGIIAGGGSGPVTSTTCTTNPYSGAVTCTTGP